jgi:pilus assembly protein CpaB
MIKSRTAVMIAAAAVLGIGAAVVASRWASSQLAGDQNTQPVVVAALDIPFGQKLEAAHVKIVPWPKTSLPGGTFDKIAEVEGKLTNQRLVPGEPLLKERIVDSLAGSTLAAMVDPKKRAITVRVNDVIGVAGFLLPGNRVDVLASRKVQRDRAQTETVLEDIRVLAVDQIASPDKDKPVVVRAVTLEVTPPQANRLVNATVEGTVQLALRNPGAKNVEVAQKPKVLTPKPAAARGDAGMTFIRGSNVELTDRQL